MLSFFANLWKSNWKNKVMLIAGLAIFLTAAILIPWAVITRHGDEGFLKASNGENLAWPKSALPLGCTVDETVTQTHQVLIDQARVQYNTKVGFNLFGPCVPWLLAKAPPPYLNGQIFISVGAIPKVGAPSTIGNPTVTMQSPWDSHPGGRALPYFRKSAPAEIVAVRMHIEPGHASNLAVWLHEFGHAAGLSHDRLRDSIMWPTILERPGSLSSKDARALRGQYGK
jgi:hypothetical protein